VSPLPALGGFDGSVSIFDVEKSSPSWVVPKAHGGLVNAIDGCGGNSVGVGTRELVSGARDGNVAVWDSRTIQPVVTIEPKTQGSDCWTVAFGNNFNAEERSVVAGYDNGDLRLIDLRTMSVRWETNVQNGVCHVSFDRKDIEMNKLSVSCLNSQLCVFDLRTFNENSGYASAKESVGKSTVWGCHYLPQDREVFATTSGNGDIQLFRYSYPMNRSAQDSRGDLVGVAGTLESLTHADYFSQQPIIDFDWHKDKKGLFAFATFDQSVQVAICSGL